MMMMMRIKNTIKIFTHIFCVMSCKTVDACMVVVILIKRDRAADSEGKSRKRKK